MKQGMETCKHGLAVQHNCYICKIEKENELLKTTLSKMRDKIRTCGEGEWADKALKLVNSVLNEVSK